MSLFQVISRNNDRNGNPYRLVLLYTQQASLIGGYEARSSSPNICGRLRKDGHAELPSFHVSPAEYNQTKKWVANHSILTYVD